MTPIQPPAISDANVVLLIFFIALVPLAIAGISLINTGFGRSRSAAHAMLAPLAVFGVAVGVYFICGFAWQGYMGGPAHSALVAGKSWSLLGAGPFFLRGLELGGTAASLAVWLQMLSVSLAALIPLGAGADRWRLSASCASTALLAGWIYPLFAHWVWGGGWLAQLGVNYGLGRGFVDAGGTASIQVVGGLTALAVAWILGPRHGKYSSEGMPTAIPGHNAVYILFGCFLALLGWLGLHSAGAILFTGVEPGRAVLISINTALAAGSAGLMAIVLTRWRFGRPDVSISANGWVGGLVAIGAGCALVAPAAAVLIGLIAGALVTFSVELFEARFGVDDPGGAISVHAVAGIWGLLALGLLVPVTESGQWMAQLVGVATLLGFVLPLTYGLNLAMNLVCRYRVPPEGERQGLDLYELGAGAYPEVASHPDDFTPPGFAGKPF
jgi:Amt family ammonium transporter